MMPAPSLNPQLAAVFSCVTRRAARQAPEPKRIPEQGVLAELARTWQQQ